MEENLVDRVIIKQIGSELYCNAVDLIPHIDKFQGFYLLKDKLVVYPRTSTRELTHKFAITVSGSYLVRVRFLNKEGIDDSIYVPITIEVEDREVIDKNRLFQYAYVFQRNNNIVFDLSDFQLHVIRITECQLVMEEQVLYNTTAKETNFKFKVNQDGDFIARIHYIDFKAESQILDIPISFKQKKLIAVDNFSALQSQDKRSPKLLLNILWAFIIREFQRKYNKGYLRYFSIILGPALQLGVMVVIFTFLGRKSVLGLSIPLFVLTGILPYGFFASMNGHLTIVLNNKALLSYRQVKISDTILANVLMELLVTIASFMGGIAACWYYGMRVIIYNPLSLMAAFSLLFLLSLGFAMILSVIGFYFAEFNYVIHIAMRGLFYISGVFFSIENIPVQYQKFLLWNPLLQIIEFIRFSFIKFELPHELSYWYLIKFTIVVFICGLSLYFVNRHKFLINDQSRV